MKTHSIRYHYYGTLAVLLLSLAYQAGCSKSNKSNQVEKAQTNKVQGALNIQPIDWSTNPTPYPGRYLYYVTKYADDPPTTPFPSNPDVPSVTNFSGHNAYADVDREKGILTNLVNGVPDINNSSLKESRWFYDTIGNPLNQTYVAPSVLDGNQLTTKVTSPMTLDQWKLMYEIPIQNAGETRPAYMERIGGVVYYNKNELGFGRELACAQFVDDPNQTDPALRYGQACYVTNFGAVPGDEHHNKLYAAEGLAPKNTVCILYRPSFRVHNRMGINHKDNKPEFRNYTVQFNTFDGNGNRVDWAQLDSAGPRPIPHICMSCHGGNYDPEKHLAYNSKFLPLDPDIGDFLGYPYNRPNQAWRIRNLNAAGMKAADALPLVEQTLANAPATVTETDKNSIRNEWRDSKLTLTKHQIQALTAMYGNSDYNQWGADSNDGWVPPDPSWQGTLQKTDGSYVSAQYMFRHVLKPYCTTCHGSTKLAFNDTSAFIMGAAKLSTSYGLLNGPMPHSQMSHVRFWQGGANSPAAQWLALADVSGDTDMNATISNVSNCNMQGGQAACGTDHSSKACDSNPASITYGKCLPEMPREAPVLYGYSTMYGSSQNSSGWCKTDGTMSCVKGQECRNASWYGLTPPMGFDGACYTCGRLGQYACLGIYGMPVVCACPPNQPACGVTAINGRCVIPVESIPYTYPGNYDYNAKQDMFLAANGQERWFKVSSFYWSGRNTPIEASLTTDGTTNFQMDLTNESGYAFDGNWSNSYNSIAQTNIKSFSARPAFSGTSYIRVFNAYNETGTFSLQSPNPVNNYYYWGTPIMSNPFRAATPIKAGWWAEAPDWYMLRATSDGWVAVTTYYNQLTSNPSLYNERMYNTYVRISLALYNGWNLSSPIATSSSGDYYYGSWSSFGFWGTPYQIYYLKVTSDDVSGTPYILYTSDNYYNNGVIITGGGPGGGL